MQKARRHPTKGLRLVVSVWFQVLFHSPTRRSFHLSLTVLVHYRSWTVFSLTGWCRQIHTGFLRSRATQESQWATFRTPTGLSPSMALLSRQLRLRRVTHVTSPTTPMQPRPHRFRLFPVRSPLLGESLLFSLPPGTEMFQFSGFAFQSLCIQLRNNWSSTSWVAPFGNPRIRACLQLPAAYRSLSRPSSPSHAKASTIHPSFA